MNACLDTSISVPQGLASSVTDLLSVRSVALASDLQMNALLDGSMSVPQGTFTLDLLSVKSEEVKSVTLA